MALKLYEKGSVDREGNKIITGYAYGEEWVSMALYMDDIRFDTPEEAIDWWEKNYGGTQDV